jgi:ketosteroid isomerase-like protein
MKLKILVTLISLILLSCTPFKVDTKKICDELMQADRDFSKYSVEHGKNAAFLQFAAEDATFLAPNSYPLVGKKLLEERQTKRPDSTYDLTWEPVYARASESGELGYTYGIWEFMVKNSNPELITKGTYVTIWKKNEKGEWKYVLDTGQEGLGEEKK